MCSSVCTGSSTGRSARDRAALLAGAAEGLRQRVGLRAWPLQQQGEAQFVAQIRQALGADRFDQGFAAGVRLNRQQAIAAVRLAQTSPAADQTSDYQRLREQPP